MGELFVLLAELAVRSGARDLKNHVGLFELKVDERLSMRLNGHPNEIGGVPPYHMALEWNGWPAGIIGPKGGVVAAGSAVNEDAMIDAVRGALEKSR